MHTRSRWLATLLPISGIQVTARGTPAPTQALTASLVEMVGQTSLGIASMGAAALDVTSIEATKGLRR